METCGDIGACITLYAFRAFDVAFMIVAAASAIAAITPTPKDDGFIARVYHILDALALNIGHAKERGRAAGGRFVP